MVHLGLNPELKTWLSIWSLHWDQTGPHKSSTWISDQGRLGAQVEMGFNQLTNYKQHQQNALKIYTFNIKWIACNSLPFVKGTEIWLRWMIESPGERDSVLPLQWDLLALELLPGHHLEKKKHCFHLKSFLQNKSSWYQVLNKCHWLSRNIFELSKSISKSQPLILIKYYLLNFWYWSALCS